MAHDVAHLRNLRPDAVVVNISLKKIAIVDLTRPFDGCDVQVDRTHSAAQHDDEAGSSGERPVPPCERARENVMVSPDGRSRINAAAQRKLTVYAELSRAIQRVQGASEWRVEFLP